MRQHKNTLREIAKFAAGLVLGDFLGLVWFYTHGFLPMTWLGLNFTAEAARMGIIFDTLLFFTLIHYGWHAEIHTPSAHKKIYF